MILFTKEDNLNNVILAIEHGVKLEKIIDENGESTTHFNIIDLLHFAAKYGSKNIIDYLITNRIFDVDVLNNKKNTPLVKFSLILFR